VLDFAELAGALVEEAATTVVVAAGVESGCVVLGCAVDALLAVVVTRQTAMHAEYYRNKLFTHTPYSSIIYCSCKRNINKARHTFHYTNGVTNMINSISGVCKHPPQVLPLS